MRRNKLLTILLLAYWLVSLSLYGIWETKGWYPATGDEPHHIIIGRAILHHGSLEQTRAYEDEFARGYLGQPGDPITRANTHVVDTPRGRFSFHSIGTGVLTVPPMVVAALFQYDDVVVIKIFFVLLSGLAVVAALALASLYVNSDSARLIAVVLTCFGLPLVIAANQVFPDLLAGVLGLCVLAWLAWSAPRPRTPLWQDAGATGVVACLPWLHYKLTVMAGIIGLAVLFAAFRKGAGWKRLLAMCVVPTIAGAVFFLYNDYAFGSPIHLDTRITLHGGSRAVMWFLALNLDRWHGFLLQNPVFFLGLVFLVPFVVRQPLVGVTALLAYVAATGINAAHGSPGYSFAGRHAWTGCLLLMPATIYGLGCLEKLSRRVFFAVAAGLLSVQVFAIAPLFMTKHDLYNPNRILWFDVYPSFFPEAMNRFLPAFYDVNWWHRHPANYCFILLSFLLVGVGAWSYPRRPEKTLRLTGGLLLLAMPVVLLVGFAQPDPPRKPLVFTARSMNRHFGIVQQDAVLASVDAHEAGIWTFGPYIRVADGDYRVRFRLQSNAPADLKVGSWDVTAQSGQVRLGSGDIMGTAGRLSEVGGTFRITSRDDGEALETRVFFADTAELRFVDVVLEPAD